jgi:catechol 2,3-dioxygenase-like lactoylglutathione lyase family enzyme
MTSPAPAIQRVVETALYVDDMQRAVAFYRDVLGLRVLSDGQRLSSIDAGGATLLLLFHRGSTRDGLKFDGGWIPPHDGAGPVHVAFAIAASDVEAWEARLAEYGIAIESRVTWTRGGRSVYFRDPDGHSIELVTPGTWETY